MPHVHCSLDKGKIFCTAVFEQHPLNSIYQNALAAVIFVVVRFAWHAARARRFQLYNFNLSILLARRQSQHKAEAETYFGHCDSLSDWKDYGSSPSKAKTMPGICFLHVAFLLQKTAPRFFNPLTALIKVRKMQKVSILHWQMRALWLSSYPRESDQPNKTKFPWAELNEFLVHPLQPLGLSKIDQPLDNQFRSSF